MVGIRIEIVEDFFVDNIKNYFSEESKTKYEQITNEIYDMSKFLNDIYPFSMNENSTTFSNFV